jgi:hypothetical protein
VTSVSGAAPAFPATLAEPGDGAERAASPASLLDALAPSGATAISGRATPPGSAGETEAVPPLSRNATPVTTDSDASTTTPAATQAAHLRISRPPPSSEEGRNHRAIRLHGYEPGVMDPQRAQRC